MVVGMSEYLKYCLKDLNLKDKYHTLTSCLFVFFFKNNGDLEGELHAQ